MAGIFITGATSGLGWAIALQSAGEGKPIGIVGRRKDRLDELSSLLKDRKVPVFSSAGDVTDTLQMESIAKDYLARFGAPDLIFANAGISGRGSTDDSPGERERAVMETNYFGVINTILPFLPAMTACRKGRILIISSLAAGLSLPGSGAYCASKAAIDRWSGSLRLELASKNIGVTIISPGYVRTEMTQSNPYPMPFIMNADKAAEIILKTARQGNRSQKEVRFPKMLALSIKLITLMPSFLQEKVMMHFQEKRNRTKRIGLP